MKRTERQAIQRQAAQNVLRRRQALGMALLVLGILAFSLWRAGLSNALPASWWRP